MTASERAVLGIVLHEPRRLRELDQLTSDHFTVAEHWEILALLREIRIWNPDLLMDHASRRPLTGGPAYVAHLLSTFFACEAIAPHVEILEIGARERAVAVAGTLAQVGAWGTITQAVVLPTREGPLVVPPWKVSHLRSWVDGTTVTIDGERIVVTLSVLEVCRRLRWTGGIEACRMLGVEEPSDA
jgi:hypothetical protein